MTPEEKQEAKDQIADLIATFEDEHNSDTIREVIQEAMEILNNAMPEESEHPERICPNCGQGVYAEGEGVKDYTLSPNQIAKRKIEECAIAYYEQHEFSPDVFDWIIDWLDQGGE